MKIIREPSVFLISEPRLIEGQVEKWLRHIGCSRETANKFAYQNSDSDVERLTELASRSCYKSFEVGLNENVNAIRGSNKEHLGNVISHLHGSVFAHGMITFAIEDISRICSHEFVRHATGTGVSQQSGRYIRLQELEVVIPHDWEDNSVNIDDDFVEKVVSYIENELISYQSKKFAGMTSFERKKGLTSMIRRLAPSSIKTGMVFSGCIRAWRNIIEQRSALGAENEIRILTEKLANVLFLRYPNAFQDYEVLNPESKNPPVFHTKNRKILLQAKTGNKSVMSSSSSLVLDTGFSILVHGFKSHTGYRCIGNLPILPFAISLPFGSFI